jgi:Fe-S-cluster containining protein
MAQPVTGDDAPLAAGEFGTWLTSTRAALRGDGDSEVPCGDCAACCTSSQFVLVEPDEADTKAHIPAQLLFPAPRRPKGYLLLGYDERGHCPMLVDVRCSIYEHRPRACRVYDCRIFVATGVPEPQEHAVEIGRRARRWQFDYATDDDRARHDTLKAAARYLADHANALGDDALATDSTRRAVVTLELHDLLVGADGETGRPARCEVTPHEVRAELSRHRR